MSQVRKGLGYLASDGQDCLQAVSMKTADRLKLAQQAWGACEMEENAIRGDDPEQTGQGGGICRLTSAFKGVACAEDYYNAIDQAF